MFQITSEASLNEFIDSHAACAVLFHEPNIAVSKQLNNLLPEFTDEFQKLGFAIVDCYAHPALAAIAKSAPRMMLFLKGRQWGALFKELQMPGINVPFVVSKLTELSDACVTPLEQRLHALVNQAPIMLFMKGSPSNPCCGFSKQVVDLLRTAGITSYGHFDILQDDEVRQGLKTYSNWPTFPQLYAQGELVGGLDIAKELFAEGSLRKELKVE